MGHAGFISSTVVVEGPQRRRGFGLLNVQGCLAEGGPEDKDPTLQGSF